VLFHVMLGDYVSRCNQDCTTDLALFNRKTLVAFGRMRLSGRIHLQAGVPSGRVLVHLLAGVEHQGGALVATVLATILDEAVFFFFYRWLFVDVEYVIIFKFDLVLDAVGILIAKGTAPVHYQSLLVSRFAILFVGKDLSLDLWFRLNDLEFLVDGGEDGCGPALLLPEVFHNGHVVTPKVIEHLHRFKEERLAALGALLIVGAGGRSGGRAVRVSGPRHLVPGHEMGEEVVPGPDRRVVTQYTLEAALGGPVK